MKRFFKAFFITLAIIAVGFGTATGYLYIKYENNIVRWENQAMTTVGHYEKRELLPERRTKIYDSENNLLCTLSEDKKRFEWTDDVPDTVKKAFIAVEDRTFYENPGYDTKGIFRVALRYVLTKGKEKHGASTITQQLVKNAYLTSEVSMERKAKEILIAKELTEKLSKDEIITDYCNVVCFGNNIYGIKEAAKEYLGKDVKDLTVAEAAFLCAIPNSPTYYEPWKNKDHTVKRQQKILNDMVECGYLTESEAETAKKQEIVVLSKDKKYELAEPDDYYTTYAIRSAVLSLMKNDNFVFTYDFSSDEDYQNYKKKFKDAYEEERKKLYSGGYTVTTSLRSSLRDTLQNAVVNNLPDEEMEAAVTVIDNETGNVVAISGGREGSGYNRAVLSTRQPGSSIKPLIAYLPALDSGWSMKSKTKSIDVDKAKKGEIVATKRLTLNEALRKSDNGTAMFLLYETGVKTGLSYLKAMEFEDIVPSDENLVAALGGLTHGTNTTEMAGAYASILNGGVYRGHTCITSIKDKDGVEQYKAKTRHIYKASSCTDIIPAMKSVIEEGTAKSMNWSLPTDAAGKTGTTNDGKDGWFSGFTPYFTVTVWAGYDTPKASRGLLGGTYPARIWKEVMTSLIKDLPEKHFEGVEDTVSDISIDKGSADYIEGDETRVLSPGYTVGNYNKDHALYQKVKELAETDPDTARQYAEEIYGNTLKKKALSLLK